MNMKKRFKNIIKKHSLDSLLAYTFVAFLMITFLVGISKLSSFGHDVGLILQIILGVLILIGIVFAIGCGLAKMITDKKAKSD